MMMSSNIINFLPNYIKILENKQTPGYIKCKFIPVTFDKSESEKELWEKHDKAFQKIKINEREPEESLLDLKIELASRVFKKCHFCERKCMADRREKSGNCKVTKSLVASEFLHFGEEDVLIPSYTIFFAGCTFHCVFCQNWDISQQICGMYIESSVLSDFIEKRSNQGAKNVNWVGGDPTPNILYILETLKQCNTDIAQIWNSNMYCSKETMKLLNGVIDLYLTDFKYGNNACAKRLSKVDNYMKIIQRNHKLAYCNGDMIIRHLVMPNHVDCCSKLALKWIASNLPNAVVNIMAQYRPEYHAHDFSDISRPVEFEEVKNVKEYAEKLGIHMI